MVYTVAHITSYYSHFLCASLAVPNFVRHSERIIPQPSSFLFTPCFSLLIIFSFRLPAPAGMLHAGCRFFFLSSFCVLLRGEIENEGEKEPSVNLEQDPKNFKTSKFSLAKIIVVAGFLIVLGRIFPFSSFFFSNYQHR